MMTIVTIGKNEIKNIILTYLHYKEYDINMVNNVSFYEISDNNVDFKIDDLIINVEFADDYIQNK